MLDRANDPAAPQPADLAAPRPLKFRGAGFAPRAGRYSGWIALALAIGLWQLAGSAGWVNPLFLPAPSAIAVAIFVVAIELGIISWIRHRYMDTPLTSAIFQVVVGGVLVFITGIVIGSS